MATTIGSVLYDVSSAAAQTANTAARAVAQIASTAARAVVKCLGEKAADALGDPKSLSPETKEKIKEVAHKVEGFSRISVIFDLTSSVFCKVRVIITPAKTPAELDTRIKKS